MSSEETSPTIPTPSYSVNNRRMNFWELKKQLKGIEKLSPTNLDTKAWKSDIKLWIDFQNVRDPEIIYTACVLTSSGETREIIQDLRSGDNFGTEDTDDEEEEEENEYPSLEKIVETVEKFYGLKEDQNVLLRDLRNLRIKKNERVKDFNIRYKALYLKLDKRRRKQVSFMDYADSLQNNREAWRKVALKDNITLAKAFEIAEKVDRLDNRSRYENYESYNYNSQNRYNKNFPSQFRKNESTEQQKDKKNEIEELTRQMRNLTIKACLFCKEKGHLQRNCPKLQEILENNCKEILQQNSLNQ